MKLVASTFNFQCAVMPHAAARDFFDTGRTQFNHLQEQFSLLQDNKGAYLLDLPSNNAQNGSGHTVLLTTAA